MWYFYYTRAASPSLLRAMKKRHTLPSLKGRCPIRTCADGTEGFIINVVFFNPFVIYSRCSYMTLPLKGKRGKAEKVSSL